MPLFKLSEEKVNESIETGAYNIASSAIFGHHVLNQKKMGLGYTSSSQSNRCPY